MLILWKAARPQRRAPATPDVPHPDGAGARHLRRRRHQGGHQRRRPRPGRLRRRACATSPTASASTVNVAHVEGDDLLDRIDGLARRSSPTSTPARRSTADPVTRQRLPRRVGHRRARWPTAPTWWCAPRHRRRARGRPGGVVVAAGAATDWDRLAGAVVAGHVIECGAQATGGNYAFFERAAPIVDTPLGFPIAEVDHDGSRVITKHPGTGGAVSRRHGHGAAALRDRRRRRTPTPTSSPASTRCRLEPRSAPDRVRISGVRGEPGAGDGQGRRSTSTAASATG